jgi:hypothetical protein
MAVGTYALTSLANLKAWIGVTVSTYDAVLESAIDRATAMVESYCDRQLKARTQYEWQMPNGERSLVVDHGPIVSINTVAFGRQTSFSVTSDTASTDVLATVGFDGTTFRLHKVTAAGSASTNTIAVSSYPATTQLVDQINGVSGWSATLTRNAYTQSLHRFGGRGVTDAVCEVHFPRDNVAEYEVEYDIGVVHVTVDRFPTTRPGAGANRFPRGFFPVFVEYVGGYETIPDDLEQVAIEIAADLYRDRLRDSTMTSESLGDYNYTRTDTAALLAQYRERLDAYRRIR